MEEKVTYSFRNQKDEIVKFTVRKPTNKEIEESDVEYSKAFFNALKKGLPTRTVLADVLAASGAWDASKDAEIEELERRAAMLSTKDVSGKEKARVEENVKELEDKASELRRVRNSYFSHCAESVASDAQRDYLVSSTTTYAESGARVWKDYQSFIDEEDGNVLFRATYEYLMFSNGIPSNLPNEEDKKEVEVLQIEPAEEAPATTESPEKTE
jgi:hypothetical protein